LETKRSSSANHCLTVVSAWLGISYSFPTWFAISTDFARLTRDEGALWPGGSPVAEFNTFVSNHGHLIGLAFLMQMSDAVWLAVPPQSVQAVGFGCQEANISTTN
jgi:hypothetical protein